MVKTIVIDRITGRTLLFLGLLFLIITSLPKMVMAEAPNESEYTEYDTPASISPEVDVYGGLTAYDSLRLGSGSAIELEPNDSYETATEIDTGAAVGGNISDGDDVDYYKFSLNRTEFINFTFNHGFVDDSNDYWQLSLYNADDLNTELFERKFMGNATRAVDTAPIGLPEGNYFVRVKDWWYSDEQYSFRINLISDEYECWEKEANDNYVQADEVPVNTGIAGSMSSSDDDDFYKFTIGDKGIVDFTFSHGFVDDSHDYWRLYLYNADNLNSCLFERGFIGNSTTAVKTSTIGLPPGTYYVKISDDCYSDEAYILTINYSVNVSSDWEQEPNDNAADADEISYSSWMNGSSQSYRDWDWYSFGLNKEDSIAVEFKHGLINSSNNYWTVELYDYDDLNECLLSESFQGNITYSVTTPVAVDAGRYCIIIKPWDSWDYSDKTYTFRIISKKAETPEEPAPAEEPSSEKEPEDNTGGGSGSGSGNNQDNFNYLKTVTASSMSYHITLSMNYIVPYTKTKRGVVSNLDYYFTVSDPNGNPCGITVKKVKATKPKNGSSLVSFKLKGKSKEERKAAKKLTKKLKKIPVSIGSALS